ncbi:hypothetical protein [Cellulomonas composti]|nr:hypothetical protein [Cellulomonas composti]
MGDIDDGFVVGTTEPVAGVNVGCRIPEGSLTPVPGNLTISTGGTALAPLVVSGLDVEGSIDVRAPWVTVRDCLARMHSGDHLGRGVYVRTAAAVGVRIEHTTVRVAEADYGLTRAYGVQGSGFTAYRVHVRGTVDGFSLAGISKRGEAHVWGCLVEDLQVHPDAGQSDGLTHNDCIQCEGNLAAVSIRGNVLRSGRTSCMLITRDYSGGAYDTAPVITDNWLRVQTSPGSLLNVKSSMTPIAGLTIARNRFTRDLPAKARIILAPAHLAAAVITATGSDRNVYETGTPSDVVPVYNGSVQLYEYGSPA